MTSEIRPGDTVTLRGTVLRIEGEYATVEIAPEVLVTVHMDRLVIPGPACQSSRS